MDKIKRDKIPLIIARADISGMCRIFDCRCFTSFFLHFVSETETMIIPGSKLNFEKLVKIAKFFEIFSESRKYCAFLRQLFFVDES